MTDNNNDVRYEQDILDFIEERFRTHGICGTDILRKTFSIGYKRARRLIGEYHKEKLQVEEIIDPAVNKTIDKLEVKTQRLQDQLTSARRVIRNQTRNLNNVEVLIESLENIIPSIKNTLPVVRKNKVNNKKEMIIQLSDLHLNEQVDLDHTKGSNEYNWVIASKRLQKYAQKCVEYADFHEIDHVYITFTGDVYNSNRRYDEIVSNSDSLAVALMIGTDLLAQFISYVSTGRTAEVISVFGNESRINQDYTSIHWEHSFDFLNHEVLKLRMREFDNIIFRQPALDHSYILENVLGANILLIHGHNKTSYEKELVKYALDPENPVVVHYMLWGHLHETLAKNNVRRSASLVGGNAYSYHRLGLMSYAEQSFHIVEKEKPGRVPVLNTHTINLDVYDQFDGFTVNRSDYYNYEQTKSLAKPAPK